MQPGLFLIHWHLQGSSNQHVEACVVLELKGDYLQESHGRCVH